MIICTTKRTERFYSHVICLGTKIDSVHAVLYCMFYSHVICLGTKMESELKFGACEFYSHVICLGTKMPLAPLSLSDRFYSHVICLGTKISNLALPTFVYHHFQIHYIIFQAFKKAISGIFSSSFHLSFSINV